MKITLKGEDMNVEKKFKEQKKEKMSSSIKEPWEEVLQEHLVEKPKDEVACSPDIMDGEQMLEKAELLKSLQNLQYLPELREPLRNALDRLPLCQSAVLDGLFWREMSLEEIARAMNKKKNAIKVLRSKGIENLKKALRTARPTLKVELLETPKNLIDEGLRPNGQTRSELKKKVEGVTF